MIRSWPALWLVVESLRPGAGGPEAAAWRRACADWTAPLALANAHLVALALYVGLSEEEALVDLPAEVRAYLELLHRSNRERNAALRRQACELLCAMGEAGIAAMLLKGGGALFLDLYHDPAARMIRDLDVLVPKRAADKALETLHALGYRVETMYPVGHHAYADFVRDGDPGAVDLHFEPIDAPYVFPARELWRRARPMREEGIEFYIPSPTDLLLHNVLHAQVQYLGNFYRGIVELRQLHEFATMVRHYGPAIDWAFVAGRMTQHHLEVPLQSYALAAQRLLALPWPLAMPPSRRAELHYRRCVAQLCFRLLDRAGTPWGNLRGAFARHRMDALYGAGESLPEKLVCHAMQYLQKSTLRSAVGRLFRVH